MRNRFSNKIFGEIIGLLKCYAPPIVS